MVRKALIICLFFVFYTIKAQNIDAFAVVKSNRTKVLVEQPLKLSVMVYTSTWFTKPLQIKNLQIEGAFVQTFSRTISSMQYIGNKKYAALEFHYIVFPYKDGELTFPELEIIVETPPENDYKGRAITLKTKPITIRVKPIPEDIDKEHWLVASHVNISNKWNSNLKELKVGDVLKRTITVMARGTLPSFIDAPIIDNINFGTIYNNEPKYFDERTDKSANGKRIDSYSYLLEEEGEYVIPEVTIGWYNPYANKYYNKKLPSYSINILENADMAALESLKDSLNVMNPSIGNLDPESSESENRDQLVTYTVIVVFGLILLILIYKIINRTTTYFKEKSDKYEKSELFWFRKFMKQTNEKSLLASLYKWIDYSPYKIKNKTIQNFVEGKERLSSDYNQLKKNKFSNATNKSIDLKLLKQNTAENRKEYFRKEHQIDEEIELVNDINP